VCSSDLEFPDSPERLQKMAAEIGADAVIVVPVGGWYSQDEVWAGKDKNSSNYNRLTGTAIKYENK
jgi:hypothetical protein